ncbi:HEAT repeat domain-containing protein [Kitasatospora sp. NA04385]|uniref:HEAT repeat domain-containing protein n=1 Tax=Kitasatospora sp. NA04385 TaxID=2742135 RepID=UPI00159068E2|nr:HEAT repeat domain-containing protein [Kitasatospora sp. NA04385]QKW23968.1 HEAT repeat domain-containing protein [Kitasatospora sp. NA04385]
MDRDDHDQQSGPRREDGTVSWTSWDGREVYAGSEWDVRTAIAEMTPEVKDGFRIDEVPWERFRFISTDSKPPAEYWLAQARSVDADIADHALDRLFHSLFGHGRISGSAPLAVPFLIRLATDPSAPRRAGALSLAAALARQHDSAPAREWFLLTAYHDLRFSFDGYLENWTIEASRLAITADTELLLPLLHDPHPEVRIAACDALATAVDDADRIAAALLAWLPAEPHPVAQASLVLAFAELAREHALPGAADRLNTLWQDPTRPAEVRFAAAIAWYCLTDTPVPDELRAVIDTYVAQDSGHALADVPWIARIDCWNSLAAITDRMLPANDHAEHPGPQ